MTSKFFERAFPGGGGCSIDCTCGRLHFCDNDSYGDITNLLRLAEKTPDRFICHEGDDSVHFITINKRIFVPGCPCGYGEEMEKFLWENKMQISEYLKNRAIEVSQRLAITALGCSSARDALDELALLERAAEDRAETSENALER